MVGFAVSLVVALACGVVLGLVLDRAAPKSTASPLAGLLVPPHDARPSALSASATSSDAFTDWATAGSDPDVKMLASDDAMSGEYSLLVTRPTSDTEGATNYVDQPVTATADAPLRLTVWAKSNGAAPGAVQIQIGSTNTAVLTLPGGTYGWTKFSLEYAVPKGVHRVNVAVISSAPTDSTWLDDIAIQGYGSTGVVLQNAGFEENSADLRLTNSTLLFSAGRNESLEMVTRRAAVGEFEWSMKDAAGKAVRSGKGRFARSAASIRVAGTPPGYYTFTVRAVLAQKLVIRTTKIGVLSAPPASAHASTSIVGVGVHLGGESAEELAQKLDDLQLLGVRYVRMDASWNQIEKSRGQYTFPSDFEQEVAGMIQRGMRPLLIADYSNPLYDGGKTPSSAAGIAAYARFAAALAAHYPTADIDVYNEFDFRFNTGACGQTPQCYLELLKPTYAAVHAASPTAGIGAPSIAGIGINADWLTGFFEGGGISSLTALSLHPYVQPAAPESLGDDLAALNTRIEAANGGRAVPIWFSEYGYSTVPGWVSEADQASYLTRTDVIAAAHGVTRVYWYDAIDDSPIRQDLESNFGLFQQPTSFAPAAYVPKPAAVAMAVVARTLDGRHFAGAVSTGSPELLEFRFSGGAGDVRVLWSTGETKEVTVDGPATITSSDGSEIGTATAVKPTTIRVGASPVIVTGTGRVTTKN